MSLTGKTVWVTGSSSGIGFEIAKAMAKKGANIILHGLTLEEGKRAGG